jgi:excisionase family DNA binding protein
MTARSASELMLTVDETATALRISKSYAKKLIAAGVVPSVRVGRCRRVRADDLGAYIARLEPDIAPADEAVPR